MYLGTLRYIPPGNLCCAGLPSEGGGNRLHLHRPRHRYDPAENAWEEEIHLNAQLRARNRTESRNTGSQGRRAKTLSRALDADSEAAPVRRAAGERGRRSIAARGERLHHLRLIRTLHPRARACSVRVRSFTGVRGPLCPLVGQ